MGEADQRVKQHIHTALGERSTRVGVLIVQGIANSIDLIEEQPTAVIEAVSEHADKLLREEPKSPRREIREAFKNYCQHILAKLGDRPRAGLSHSGRSSRCAPAPPRRWPDCAP